jgi:hypothetical protein
LISVDGTISEKAPLELVTVDGPFESKRIVYPAAPDVLIVFTRVPENVSPPVVELLPPPPPPPHPANSATDRTTITVKPAKEHALVLLGK